MRDSNLDLLVASATSHTTASAVPDRVPSGAQQPIFSVAPTFEGAAEFCLQIEAARAALDPGTWRALCQSEARPWAAWAQFMLADPFTRHALQKPRGYAGDASLMDYAYGHSAVAGELEAATPLGRDLYAAIYANGMSASARMRTDLVAECLAQAIDRGGPVTVASFAAGHARELEKLDAERAGRILRFTSVDTDPVSQAEVERAQSGRIPIRSLRRSALRVQSHEVGAADFVYAMGLFDYLRRPFAERVIATMAQCVRPGGTLLVGNLCPETDNIGYCEAVTDWWMILRTEAEMASLGVIVTDLGPDWSVEVLRHGCFFYILARRDG